MDCLHMVQRCRERLSPAAALVATCSALGVQAGAAPAQPTVGAAAAAAAAAVLSAKPGGGVQLHASAVQLLDLSAQSAMVVARRTRAWCVTSAPG